MEFSLAAILSSNSGDLRGGGAAHGIAVNDCSYDRAYPGRSDGNRCVYLPDVWFLRFSAWLDFSWIGRRLVFVGIARTPFQISTVDARRDHVCRVAGHLSLHPDKLRSSADTIFLKNCLNPLRSIPSGFISACIRGQSLHIVRQTRRSRSAKRCAREARRCGPACASSMAIARSAPPAWPANSQPDSR